MKSTARDSPQLSWRRAWRGVRVPAIWTLVYHALAVAGTWPVARVFTTHLPHDLGDPLLSLTLLDWNASTPPFTREWWNGVGFYPTPDTMTLSDPRLGPTLVSAPVQWITGSAAAGHNAVFILSWVLSALAAHALAFRLTRRHAAGVVAGCAFGFAPFRAPHLAHLELLCAFPIPVALLAAHAWLETRRRAWLALLAAAVAGQGLFAAYYLPMLGVLLAGWGAWFAAGRVPPRQLAALAASALAGVAALVPLFLAYEHAHAALGLTREIGEIRHFSADVSSLWSAAPELRLWPTFAQANTEQYLFPGLTVVALVLAALRRGDGRPAQRPGEPVAVGRVRGALVAVAGIFLLAIASSQVAGAWALDAGPIELSVSGYRKPLSLALLALFIVGLLSDPARAVARARSTFAFYALAAALMFLLALGPDPTLLGVPVLHKAPYAWLMIAPGFDDTLRVPARFGMLMALALAVAAALAWDFVSRRLPRRRAVIFTAGLSAAILAEGWVAPMQVVELPPVFAWPDRCAGVPRLDLPIGDPFGDAAAQYRARADGVRSVNGLSGYVPGPTAAVIAGVRERDDRMLTTLARFGPICATVDPRADDAAALEAWLAAHPLVERLEDGRNGEVFFLLRDTAGASTGPR